MSCDAFHPNLLATRHASYSASARGRAAGDRGAVAIVEGDNTKVIKTTVGRKTEPERTCLAGELGVGPKMYDAWTRGDGVTSMVTERYDLGTLSDYWSQQHDAEGWHELEAALLYLFDALDRAKENHGLTHKDMSPDNIVLRRRSGRLEARAVDWDDTVATAGEYDRLYESAKGVNPLEPPGRGAEGC